MLTSALLAVSLSATSPLKLAITPFNVPGAGADRADFFAEHLADRLVDQGLDVVTPREIGAILGVERQRQLLGCGESDCLVELGGALGAQGVVLGSLAHVGAVFQLDIKVISPSNAKRVAIYSMTVDTEEKVLGALARGAWELATQLQEAYHVTLSLTAPPPEPPTATVRPTLRSWWWVPGLVFVASGVAGVTGLSIAEGRRQVLVDTTALTTTQADTAYQDGVLARTLGWTGVGVAVAALATSVGFVLFGGPAPVTPVASWNGSTATLGVVGSFE